MGWSHAPIVESEVPSLKAAWTRFLDEHRTTVTIDPATTDQALVPAGSTCTLAATLAAPDRVAIRRSASEDRDMAYVQLGDVRTFYEEDGAGEPLVLLHPGLADSRAFEGNVPGLAEHFRVFRPDRRGHGRTPDVAGPITYEQMAWDTVAFLEQVVGGPAYLVGHSDGAPVALLVALRRPDLVRRLVFSAGVFHHEGWTPGAIEMNAEVRAFFAEYHGAVSPDGPSRFPIVVEKLHRMHLEEPTLTVADLAAFPGPSLVMVGDDDGEIYIEHTLALRRGLVRSQLAIVPGAGHGSLAEKSDLCNRLIVDFLTAT